MHSISEMCVWQWRYSEFLEAVENNKIERVLFNKDGDVLQALAEGRRALVIVPKDPQLLDTLLKHNVDFQGACTLLRANASFCMGRHVSKHQQKNLCPADEFCNCATACILCVLAVPTFMSVL